MRRVDAHLHVWNLERGGYAWPTSAEPAIFRTFRLTDVADDLARTRIDRTILVQAADSLEDTSAMLAAARSAPGVAGVVGWVPLGDRSLAEAAFDQWADDRIRGIRHLIHWESDARWLARADLRDGFQMLVDRRLAFDIVAVFPDHLNLVPDLADRHPDLSLVIDHLAKPPFGRADWSRWVSEIRAAAERPNVAAKVSGLDTAIGTGWQPLEIQPAVDVALEAFGPSRLMFGSDWPVCRSVSTYQQVTSAVEASISELSATEQSEIMGGTATRIYRLA